MLRIFSSRFAVPMLVWAAATFGMGHFPASGQSFFEPIGAGGPPQAPVVQATAEFTAPAADKPGELTVTATMTAGWHIYSITQAPGGPVQTKIKTEPPIGVVIGPFTALDAPHVQPEPDFNNLLVESHEGKVSWKAQLSIPPGVDPATLEIKGSVFAQACNMVCLPPQDYKFTAKLKGAAGTGQATSNVSVPPATVAPSNSPPPIAPPIPGINVPGLPDLNLPPVPAPVVEGYKPRLAKVRWQGRLEPATVTPGDTAKLHFTATPIEGWHVYAAQNVPLPATGNQATSLVFSDSAGFKTTPLATTQTPLTHALGETSSLPYFEQPVTWTSDIVVPADAKPGEYKLTGSLGFQTCLKTCLNPEAVQFAATLSVGDTTGGSKALEFIGPMLHREHAKAFNAWLAEHVAQNPEAATSGASAPAAFDISRIRSSNADEQSTSLPLMLLTGLLAGFILNFMPCVLPVIGLKVLSFIEQSHHDRRRVFFLNAWYSLGIISVFWVLAGISIGLHLWANTTFSWGKQFSFDGFNITLVAVVFVMALSFLGVWEIPIPGFAGGKGAQKLASKEGFTGAFAKGILTTVLATPCSGPFLGTAVAFALRESPPVTFAMFTAMGFGMALPYLVIGIKPELVKFLPKPGEWMDTFKQIMGFVLLGTVVWIMSSIHVARLLPTITFLIALWAGCWWIGRTPAYAEQPQKLRAWASATAWSVLLGWFAFSWLQGVVDARMVRFVDQQIAERMKAAGAAENIAASHSAETSPDALPWRSFTLTALEQSLQEGKTVLVEFTADWCLTCKTLKRLYLDRPETKQLVQEYEVVTLEADMTRPPESDSAFLEKLSGGGGVPVIAVFSAANPNEPIVFANGYTQAQILEALRKVGPSKKSAAVSMR